MEMKLKEVVHDSNGMHLLIEEDDKIWQFNNCVIQDMYCDRTASEYLDPYDYQNDSKYIVETLTIRLQRKEKI